MQVLNLVFFHPEKNLKKNKKTTEFGSHLLPVKERNNTHNNFLLS